MDLTDLQLPLQLQIEPQPEMSQALGSAVDLHELSYGELRQAMTRAQRSGRAGEALLAQALWVNGQPMGLAALDALPGRLAGAIGRAMERCLQLHGMDTAPAPAASDAPPAVNGAPDDADESPEGNA